MARGRESQARTGGAARVALASHRPPTRLSPFTPHPEWGYSWKCPRCRQLSRALLEALRRCAWIVSCSREGLPRLLPSCTRPKRGCSWSESPEKCQGQGRRAVTFQRQGYVGRAWGHGMAVKIQETWIARDSHMTFLSCLPWRWLALFCKIEGTGAASSVEYREDGDVE